MKALFYTKSGGLDVLKVKEIKKPTPSGNQYLITVKAVALNISDYERFKSLSDKVSISTRLTNIIMKYKGKPLGAEVSGVVVATGKNISYIKVGDYVFGKTTGIAPAGGLAEYALLDQGQVEIKPKNYSFEQAAAVSISFETALGAIRRAKAKIQKNQQVMIYGSSGGVGLYAVQLAKINGATVTGVCSTRNINLATKAGCDNVIDYQANDFTRAKIKFDAIVGVNGCNSMKRYKKLLQPDGIFVGVGNVKQGFIAMLASLTSKNFTYYVGPMMPQKNYLHYAKQLAESGQLTPYIDKIYDFKDSKESIRYLLTKHAQGKVVIKMNI